MLKGDMCIFSNVYSSLYTRKKALTVLGITKGGEFYILHVVCEFNLKRIVIII